MCVAGFIQQLEEPKERDAFQPMVSPMLATLGRCLTVRPRRPVHALADRVRARLASNPLPHAWGTREKRSGGS
jgi:hypothetical protein